MKIAFPKWLAAIFLGLIAFGCEVENSNEVGCVEKDCQAACLQSGFIGGTCVGVDHCTCAAGSTDPYDWRPPTTDVDAGDASIPAPGPDGGGAP